MAVYAGMATQLAVRAQPSKNSLRSQALLAGTRKNLIARQSWRRSANVKTHFTLDPRRHVSAALQQRAGKAKNEALERHATTLQRQLSNAGFVGAFASLGQNLHRLDLQRVWCSLLRAICESSTACACSVLGFLLPPSSYGL